MKTTINPYRIKLRYSGGIPILERCVKGIEFLEDIKWNEETL
jgi:hypothetical protein